MEISNALPLTDIQWLFDAILREALDQHYDGAPDGGGVNAAVRSALADGSWNESLAEIVADVYHANLCSQQRTSDPTLPSERRPTPLERLRHHVSGAIERGEAEPIEEKSHA